MDTFKRITERQKSSLIEYKIVDNPAHKSTSCVQWMSLFRQIRIDRPERRVFENKLTPDMKSISMENLFLEYQNASYEW